MECIVKEETKEIQKANPIITEQQSFKPFFRADGEYLKLNETDVSFEDNRLKIKMKNYNLSIQPPLGLSIKGKEVKFAINSEYYCVEFKSEKKATDFYNLLKSCK